MGIKVCKKCDESKPATTDYFESTGIKGGLRNKCRVCRRLEKSNYIKNNKEIIKERNKRYRNSEENREKINKRMKEYYKENKESIKQKNKLYQTQNREKVKARKLKYYQSNKEGIMKKHKDYYEERKGDLLEYAKEYREKHKEEIAVKRKKYYEKNKNLIAIRNIKYRQENIDKYREYSRMYNQERRSKQRGLPATLTSKQWEESKKAFNNKCAYCGKETRLSQDHFIPLDIGGEFTHNNIIPACGICNSSKNNKDFFEWFPNYEHYSKSRERKIMKFLGYSQNKNQQLSIL